MSINVSLNPTLCVPELGLLLEMNRSISMSLTSVGSKAPKALRIFPRATVFSVPAPFSRGCERSTQAKISSCERGMAGSGFAEGGSAAGDQEAGDPRSIDRNRTDVSSRRDMAHTPFMRIGAGHRRNTNRRPVRLCGER